MLCREANEQVVLWQVCFQGKCGLQLTQLLGQQLGMQRLAISSKNATITSHNAVSGTDGLCCNWTF